MKMEFIFICLISGLLSLQYLPYEGMINLPANSDSGIIFLSYNYFNNKNNIYVFFRIKNGEMDSTIYYTETTQYPTSDEQFQGYNQKQYINRYKEDETTIYIFEFSPLNNGYYYLFKYSGFSGKALNVTSSYYYKVAKYVPKGKAIILSKTEMNGYIYLKYEDFPDSDDIYIYFEDPNGYMKSTIQYKETNIDPGYIISFSDPQKKEGNKVYFFSKSNYKFLTIFYSLNKGIELSVSSSIKIKYLSGQKTLTLGSNSNYGYIYLKLSDFHTIDDLFIYFETYEGAMNPYIEYEYTQNSPEYEEQFTYLEKKYSDKYSSNIYRYEFPSNDRYDYLVIKYSGFSGKSLYVSSSTKIKYLSKDDKIEISNSKHEYGYIYLKYDDFLNSVDKQYIYLYFKIYKGKMNDYIYYTNTDTNPIYERQFSFKHIKYFEKKDNSYYNNPIRYLYKFEKESGYEYLVIKYSGLTKGNLLNIYILPINPVAYSLSKEQSLCLSYFLKSGFIYFDYSVFSKNGKGIDYIYVCFEVDGIMNSNLEYINTDMDPNLVDYESKMSTKYVDNKDEKNIPRIFSYKFNIMNRRYFIIKYSGFNGNRIKVYLSITDPFRSLTTLIVSLSVGGVILIAIISVIIFLILRRRRKRKSEMQEFIDSN